LLPLVVQRVVQRVARLPLVVQRVARLPLVVQRVVGQTLTSGLRVRKQV
jgi:hypothetical protein